VRDERSASCLRDAGISYDGILPDLSFNLFRTHVPQSKEVRTVCLSFRTDQFPTQLDRIKRFLEQLLQLLPEQAEIRLLAQVVRDIPGMQALQMWLETRLLRRPHLFINCESIAQNESLFRLCDVVFSNRLHVLLLGGSVCGRVVACVDGYQPKIDGVFRMHKLSAAILHVEEELTEASFRSATQVAIDGRPEREWLRQELKRVVSE
jgi:polysaccharide pyruvyl transferase WcaK-like protein